MVVIIGQKHTYLRGMVIKETSQEYYSSFSSFSREKVGSLPLYAARKRKEKRRKRVKSLKYQKKSYTQKNSYQYKLVT